MISQAIVTVDGVAVVMQFMIGGTVMNIIKAVFQEK